MAVTLWKKLEPLVDARREINNTCTELAPASKEVKNSRPLMSGLRASNVLLHLITHVLVPLIRRLCLVVCTEISRSDPVQTRRVPVQRWELYLKLQPLRPGGQL